jgi:uncharacterized protein
MKKRLHIMGLITLIVFPIPSFLYLHLFKEHSLYQFLQLNRISDNFIFLGIEFGIIYSFLVLLIMRASIFQSIPDKIELLLQSLKLNIFDCVFLSLCAGIGEELLFRSGVQDILGPWFTSVLFVAIHGYLNPFNLKKSMYGLLVLPFIILISLAYTSFGLWFCIGAHFSYDLVLFLALRKENQAN